VYQSDSDSEPGDPKYRVGSRFSSYYADSTKANKQEGIASPVQEISLEEPQEYATLYQISNNSYLFRDEEVRPEFDGPRNSKFYKIIDIL